MAAVSQKEPATLQIAARSSWVTLEKLVLLQTWPLGLIMLGIIVQVYLILDY